MSTHTHKDTYRKTEERQTQKPERKQISHGRTHEAKQYRKDRKTKKDRQVDKTRLQTIKHTHTNTS